MKAIIKNKSQKKKFIKSVVAESISLLLKEAENNYLKHPGRSNSYIKMLWNLVKKYKIKLTDDQKLSFCKKCLAYWMHNETVKVAFNSKLNAFCFICSKCGYKKIIRKK